MTVKSVSKWLKIYFKENDTIDLIFLTAQFNSPEELEKFVDQFKGMNQTRIQERFLEKHHSALLSACNNCTEKA